MSMYVDSFRNETKRFYWNIEDLTVMYGIIWFWFLYETKKYMWNFSYLKKKDNCTLNIYKSPIGLKVHCWNGSGDGTIGHSDNQI